LNRFYLTGGTAVSRAYLQHRFSDDLDLFVNYDKRFALWSNLLIQVLRLTPDGGRLSPRMKTFLHVC